MKTFLYFIYILSVAHDTAAFVCTQQSSYVSTSCVRYNEKCRVQRSCANMHLFAMNDKNNIGDKLTEEKEISFGDALMSALQEIWMLKDDEEVS